MSARLTPITKQKVHERRYRIDLAKSYRYMEYFRDHYNDQQEDKKNRLKNEYLLAKELVRLYRAEFLRWQEENHHQVEIAYSQLPLLAVNNQFLGRVLGKTDRTIQNYRKKLIQAGILLPVSQDEEGKAEYSVFHGRTCDYEIRINPKIFHISSNLHTRRVEVAGIADFFDITKNFRPTSTSTGTSTLTRTKLEQLAEKNENKPMSIAQEPLEGTKQEPLSEAQEPAGQNGQSNQPPVLAQQEQKIPAAPSPAEASAQADHAKNPPLEPENTEETTPQTSEILSRRYKIVQAYAKTLLNSARTYLYPNEHFDQARMLAVCHSIETLFGDAPEEKLLKILNNYQHRLKLAQLHWHKKYGALPEVEDFFDKDNPAGFRLTGEFEDDRAQYPPPKRSTYRLARQLNRGAGKGHRSGTGRIGDVIHNQ